MTKMVSEFWMVLRRWAMLTMPKPPSALLAMWSMVLWIIFSEVLSNALVASSKKRKDAFLTRARAMAMRCFWPPENCDPLEPTKVLNLSGKLSTKVSWASRQALSTSSFETPLEPSMMFSTIEVAKRTGS
mmetsp:Transcript_97849/g.315012  ORF Transcript_97849/g.315012 Transcript_97849/m.315012 type:complete len:130 (-) Transcript_97849:754-1143(-)